MPISEPYRERMLEKLRFLYADEAGDILIPINDGEIDKSHMYAELGEIVTGRKPARADDKEITLFKSNGLAIQDAATAKLVYDKAVEMGIGNKAEI